MAQLYLEKDCPKIYMMLRSSDKWNFSHHLKLMHIQLANKCPLCLTKEELVNHCFVSCIITKKVWLKIVDSSMLRWIPSEPFMNAKSGGGTGVSFQKVVRWDGVWYCQS